MSRHVPHPHQRDDSRSVRAPLAPFARCKVATTNSTTNDAVDAIDAMTSNGRQTMPAGPENSPSTPNHATS